MAKKDRYSVIPLIKFQPNVPLSIIRPRLNKKSLVNYVDEQWVQKQPRSLPKSLTAEVLCENLKLTYVPYWVISADVTASWSAQYAEYIEKTKRVWVNCSTCNGRGHINEDTYVPGGNRQMVREVVKKTCSSCGGSRGEHEQRTDIKTKWHNASGNISEKVNDNTPDLQHYFMRTGLSYNAIAKPDAQIGQAQHNSSKLKNLPILTPNNTKPEIAKKLFEAKIPDLLRSKASLWRDTEYRNFRLSNQKINITNCSVCLCPVYVGTYSHGRSKKAIEINATTGQIELDMPRSKVKMILKLGWLLVKFAIISFILFMCAGVIFVATNGTESGNTTLQQRARLIPYGSLPEMAQSRFENYIVEETNNNYSIQSVVEIIVPELRDHFCVVVLSEGNSMSVVLFPSYNQNQYNPIDVQSSEGDFWYGICRNQ